MFRPSRNLSRGSLPTSIFCCGGNSFLLHPIYFLHLEECQKWKMAQKVGKGKKKSFLWSYKESFNFISRGKKCVFIHKYYTGSTISSKMLDFCWLWLSWWKKRNIFAKIWKVRIKASKWHQHCLVAMNIIGYRWNFWGVIFEIFWFCLKYFFIIIFVCYLLFLWISH